jgi:NAD kinase
LAFLEIKRFEVFVIELGGGSLVVFRDRVDNVDGVQVVAFREEKLGRLAEVEHEEAADEDE